MATGRPGPGVGVVGHVEWVTHALGPVPDPGAIVDLRAPLDEPAGGGAVAAVAMARLAGAALLFTALGDDERAGRSAHQLRGRGVEVLAARRSAPQTPVLSITAAGGERTIMVVGERLQPTAADPLPWDRIDGLGAVYYAGEDPGSLAHARRARALVVTARRIDDVRAAGVQPDIIVASASDADEDPWGLPGAQAPGAIVVTDGSRGGTVHEPGGKARRYPAVAAPGDVVDSYGCGDSFAAALGIGLDGAIALAAHAGALCATWRGGLGPA